jgi:hypothetical protein
MHTLSVTFTPTDTADYRSVSQTATLNVLKATPTVTWANPADITYGTPLSSTQLDASADVAGTLAYSPAAGTLLGAGSYTLSVTFTPTDTADYNSVTQAATLNVLPQPLTITPDANQSQVYGAATPALTYTASGLVNGDTNAVFSGSLSTTATSASPVATYAFTLGTLSAGSNYQLVLASNPPTFAVTPATLLVMADNAVRSYGVANPTFTDTITGFVNGDTASVVSGTPTLSTTATASTAPGSYPITAGTGTLAAANYRFSPVNGTLTIHPAPLSATAVNFSVPVGSPFSVPLATFSNSDPFGNPSSYDATIDWGDGSSSAGTISDSGAGTFTVSGSHTYTSAGSATVSVHISHHHGFTTTASATASAAISGDVVVDGTIGDDNLVLMRTPGGQPGDITYTLNGAAPVSLRGVTSFTFNGGAGNDTMTVSLANGGPIVSNGPVAFDGGTGVNTLNLDAATLPVRIVPGSFNAAGQAVNFSNTAVTHVNNAAAVDAFAGPDTADRTTAFAGLNAQERFVQALYLDDLGRAGTRTEVDDWLNGQLNQPGGSPQVVAAAIAGSPEADDHLVQSWYFAFLGRQAQGGEEQGWASQLLAGQTEEQVLSQILGSAEFYDRAQTLGFGGTADQNYVQPLYQVLLNRRASSSELDNGVAALQTMGRQGLALALLDSQEFRGDQFAGYFATLLHRPADTSLAGWVTSGLDAHSVRVAFESGMEFYSNG